MYADYLTVQILRGDITVEQARGALLEYHYRHTRKAVVQVVETMAEIEAHAIADAMNRNGDNVEATAKELNISRTTLYRKIR